MFNKSKGFTIIELLVVVAIIAVLAAIVLVNVTQYINKGKNAAIEGNLATILTNAAVWYDGHGNYTGFTADVSYTGPDAAVKSAKGAATDPITTKVTAAGDKFCSYVTLMDGTTTYCVDSSGFKGTLAASKCDGTASWQCN